MKFLRIGKTGQEIPVALDKSGKYNKFCCTRQAELERNMLNNIKKECNKKLKEVI